MTQVATVSLQKGEKADLTKTHPGLKAINCGLGWDVGNPNETDPAKKFDLDAFALLLKGGKVTNSHDIVFFNNKEGQGVKSLGDNLTGEGAGDDETIEVKLDQVQADEVLIAVNIYKAVEKKQNFGQVKNAFVRLYDAETKKELVRYDLSEDYSGNTGVVVGRIYKHQGEWKFQAVGEGKNGDINQIAATYS